MEKIYNKLVRDNIPEMCIANKEEPVIRILSDEEYKMELMKKMGEELLEVRLANTNEEMTEELADLLELIISLNKYIGNTSDKLYEVLNNKRQVRGSFDKKILLEKVIVNDRENQ